MKLFILPIMLAAAAPIIKKATSASLKDQLPLPLCNCKLPFDVMHVQDFSGGNSSVVASVKKNYPMINEFLQKHYPGSKLALSGFIDKPLPFLGFGGGRLSDAYLKDTCYTLYHPLQTETPSPDDMYWRPVGGGSDQPDNQLGGLVNALLDPDAGWSVTSNNPQNKRQNIAFMSTNGAPHGIAGRGKVRPNGSKWGRIPAYMNGWDVYYAGGFWNESYGKEIEAENSRNNGGNPFSTWLWSLTPELMFSENCAKSSSAYDDYINLNNKVNRHIKLTDDEQARLVATKSACFPPDFFALQNTTIGNWGNDRLHPGTFLPEEKCTDYEYPTPKQVVDAIKEREAYLITSYTKAGAHVWNDVIYNCAGLKDEAACLNMIYEQAFLQGGLSDHYVAPVDKNPADLPSDKWMFDLFSGIQGVHKAECCDKYPGGWEMTTSYEFGSFSCDNTRGGAMWNYLKMNETDGAKDGSAVHTLLDCEDYSAAHLLEVNNSAVLKAGIDLKSNNPVVPQVRTKQTFNKSLFVIKLKKLDFACGTRVFIGLSSPNMKKIGFLNLFDTVGAGRSVDLNDSKRLGSVIWGPDGKVKMSKPGARFSTNQPNCQISEQAKLPAKRTDCSLHKDGLIEQPAKSPCGTYVNNVAFPAPNWNLGCNFEAAFDTPPGQDINSDNIISGGYILALNDPSYGVKVWYVTNLIDGPTATPAPYSSGPSADSIMDHWNPDPSKWGPPLADFPIISDCNLEQENPLRDVSLTIGAELCSQDVINSGTIYPNDSFSPICTTPPATCDDAKLCDKKMDLTPSGDSNGSTCSEDIAECPTKFTSLTSDELGEMVAIDIEYVKVYTKPWENEV